MHKATEDVLQYFEYSHLPEPQARISESCYRLAHKMADGLEGPELTVGLRKLLEAKDAFVRASLAARD